MHLREVSKVPFCITIIKGWLMELMEINLSKKKVEG